MYSLKSIFAETKKSLHLSIPLIAAQLIYGLSGFVSIMMVAHLGAKELAANALGWIVFITLNLFFIGVLSATGVLVAQSYGAKDTRGVRLATSQGFILSIFFAFMMMAITWFAPLLLILTHQDPEIIKLATPFFHAIIWVMIPGNILFVLEYFLTGIGRSRLVLLQSITEVSLDIFFFYVFIFGKFGMPRCGLAGIGYGFTVACILTIIIFGTYLYLENCCRKYFVLKNFWEINKKYLWETIRIGTPIGFAFGIEIALFAALTLLMGKLGTEVLAAHQITYQAFSLVLTIIAGLSQGTSTRVGHEVGRNNKSTLKLTVLVNNGIGLCVMFLLALIYWFFPRFIISFDLDISAASMQNIINYTINFLVIAAALQISECVRMLYIAALRGIKDTKMVMYVSFATCWLLIFPLAYYLGFIYHLGGAGIWLSVFIGSIIATIILITRFNELIARVSLARLVTK